MQISEKKVWQLCSVFSITLVYSTKCPNPTKSVLPREFDDDRVLISMQSRTPPSHLSYQHSCLEKSHILYNTSLSGRRLPNQCRSSLWRLCKQLSILPLSDWECEGTRKRIKITLNWVEWKHTKEKYEFLPAFKCWDDAHIMSLKYERSLWWG